MPAPETNTRKIIARLKAEGWQSIGGSRHEIFRHPILPGRVAVPRHRTLSDFVAHQIAKVAGWNQE